MFQRVFISLLILALQSCAQPPQPVAPMVEQEPVVTAPTPPKKTPSIQVTILVSENIPAYSEVANELFKQLGRRGTILYLSRNQLGNLKLVNKLKNEENTQVVSIGLSASVAAKALTNKQVVFCQVYNYQDYGLLSSKHKGVSMLPSISKTFSIWHALSPNTTDIGVISGPGFDHEIQSVKSAAKVHGFQLHFETVTSDKEYQYTYKKLSKKVQGFWLLPDNRVLSEHILRDIMTFSVRNSKQVTVFSNELLKLGGLMSISSDNRDIAHQVLERLEQAQHQVEIPGPDIVNLDKVNLRINSVMANNFKLKIPVQYSKYASAP